MHIARILVVGSHLSCSQFGVAIATVNHFVSGTRWAGGTRDHRYREGQFGVRGPGRAGAGIYVVTEGSVAASVMTCRCYVLSTFHAADVNSGGGECHRDTWNSTLGVTASNECKREREDTPFTRCRKTREMCTVMRVLLSLQIKRGVDPSVGEQRCNL